MEIHEKVRAMREIHQWSQEEMAEKMGMSAAGYAKIERGQTKLNFEKLQQIANVFQVDLIEFIASKDKGLICFIGENNGSSANYYGADESLVAENEKLKLLVQHKEELLAHHQTIIAQKENEIVALKEIVNLLKKQISE